TSPLCSILISDRNIQLISAQSPDEIGVIAFLLSRFFRKRLQLQVHTDILSPWYRKASTKELFRVLCARIVLPKADCIRVVSQRIARSLIAQLKISKNRITILPIFTDLRQFLTIPRGNSGEKTKEHKDTFHIISAGRFLEKEKQFSLLIHMMEVLRPRYPSLRVSMIGEGPSRHLYQQMIRQKRLEDAVQIYPWTDTLASFLADADLFVLVSRYEGWGRVVLEAMASELPVIMTDVGLAGEILVHEENGIVIPVGDTSALISWMEQLVQDEALRSRLASSARRQTRLLASVSYEAYLQQYKQSFSHCCVI
ncbi:MAG: glycosyltransferase, partial [Parcubacteria group bacterium Gr01-1014_66]